MSIARSVAGLYSWWRDAEGEAKDEQDGMRFARNRLTSCSHANDRSVIKHPVSQLVATLYPPTCVLCGASGERGLDLCAGCLGDMPWNRHACPRCGLPLPAAHPAGTPCGDCLRRPPPFASCHTAFRYEDPVPNLVGAAKFRSRLNAARVLAECLLLSLREPEVPLPELIIPVPLHPRRLRQRGYNQSLELARPLGRALGVRVDTASCVRTQATAPQAGLEKAARRRNIRGAFRTTRQPSARHVAVLDDVVTTGSTVSELTKVLKRAGVERVDVWAVARTE
jgi:ComF family protein